MKKTLLVVFLIALAVKTSDAQNKYRNGRFYNFSAGNHNNGQRLSITWNRFGAVSNDGKNDTQAINKAINEASSRGGGTVYIPSGIWHFKSVLLKSNVKILVNKGAVLKPFVTSTIAGLSRANQKPGVHTFLMFNIGLNSFVKNVAIIGENGRFLIDYTNSPYEYSRAFSLGNASNFRISNVNHKDNRSTYPTINAAVVGPNDAQRSPRSGLINNLSVTNTVYGYGLIQMQAGRKIVYKNLSSQGGITLRLESDFRKLHRAIGAKQKIGDIFGFNITNNNGQAAVQLSPHIMEDQGFVSVTKITANGSEFALKIEPGFISPKDVAAFPGQTLKPGFFDSKSEFTEIYFTKGDKAQVRNVFLRFIPCNRRALIDSKNEGEWRVAPSIAPVLQFSGNLPTGRKSYPVSVSNIKSSSNNYVRKIIKDFCAHDFQNCTAAEKKYTTNPGFCVNGSKSLTSNDKLNIDSDNAVLFYPNPANNFLNIKANTSLKVTIHDINSKVIKKFDLEKTSTSNFPLTEQLDVSDIPAGIYFVKTMSDTGSQQIKKLLIN